MTTRPHTKLWTSWNNTNLAEKFEKAVEEGDPEGRFDPETTSVRVNLDQLIFVVDTKNINQIFVTTETLTIVVESLSIETKEGSATTSCSGLCVC